ncbi:MAG: pyridoxamine kinase [Lachnospiraceae bacterium]|nr:pyridoxamine kinase [Lachnospiraceae bacterium]
MSYKRILTIQDISCIGQCSLTVALPILSVCGHETVILPSAVLSTHTGGFSGFTFRDLTEDIPLIKSHWQKEGIAFDAIYSGYLGSIKQIDYLSDILSSMGNERCIKIVDPAMADNGKLYSNFDLNYAEAMTTLCSKADIILPNITEASIMTGLEYEEDYDDDYITALIRALRDKGMKTIIMTGVSYSPNTTGVIICEGNEISYYKHEKLEKGSHGTGDIFASAFTGSHLSGKNLYDSAKIAADFVLEAMKNTSDDSEHWYGVKFEPILHTLADKLSI